MVKRKFDVGKYAVESILEQTNLKVIVNLPEGEISTTIRHHPEASRAWQLDQLASDWPVIVANKLIELATMGKTPAEVGARYWRQHTSGVFLDNNSVKIGGANV